MPPAAHSARCSDSSGGSVDATVPPPSAPACAQYTRLDACSLTSGASTAAAASPHARPASGPPAAPISRAAVAT
eukprot:364927-Chlamydomonas_euryale.AAC.10